MTVYLRRYKDGVPASHVLKNDVQRTSVWTSDKLYTGPDGEPENMLYVVLWLVDGETQSFTDVIDIELF